ncbi:MAG: helix-turn-helix transcriptional regulator, partial [Pseudomonadota bacterium]
MGSRAIIAKNIKHFRLQKRLSQEQLALQADVDRTYVSALERG